MHTCGLGCPDGGLEAAENIGEHAVPGSSLWVNDGQMVQKALCPPQQQAGTIEQRDKVVLLKELLIIGRKTAFIKQGRKHLSWPFSEVDILVSPGWLWRPAEKEQTEGALLLLKTCRSVAAGSDGSGGEESC